MAGPCTITHRVKLAAMTILDTKIIREMILIYGRHISYYIKTITNEKTENHVNGAFTEIFKKELTLLQKTHI